MTMMPMRLTTMFVTRPAAKRATPKASTMGQKVGAGISIVFGGRSSLCCSLMVISQRCTQR